MAPNKDWKEIVSPDEDARFAVFANQLVELQRMHTIEGRAGRALHHKMHVGFEASLEILTDLPEPARHGLFAIPRTYDAWVRFSNGSSLVQSDDKADIRGLAVKVLGVDGPKAVGTARTQDFLSILQSVTPFRTADEFMAVVWASRNKWLALPRMFFALGFRLFPILSGLKRATGGFVASLLEHSFFSCLPMQCGPYAARFAWVPLAAPSVPTPNGASRFADDLTARLRLGAASYALELQFFVDEQRTPIEDGSVDWPEAVAPYVRVAKLVIPQQDAASEHGQRVAERIAQASFDPWHALVEHRPLGGMMRARKVAYFASAKGRAAREEPNGKMG